jgi:hypothetical protein
MVESRKNMVFTLKPLFLSKKGQIETLRQFQGWGFNAQPPSHPAAGWEMAVRSWWGEAPDEPQRFEAFILPAAWMLSVPATPARGDARPTAAASAP